MSLDHLWAGWRNDYVSGIARSSEEAVAGAGAPAGEGGAEPCVFCRIVATGEPSEENGILWRGDLVAAVLNAYPYACGHLMLLPLRHLGALDELTGEEASQLWTGLRAGVAALQAAYAPEGVNIGANLGRAAGAGIPRHLHLHAVPRWVGDTNFMTSVAGVRVLPEALPQTWSRLRAAWPS